MTDIQQLLCGYLLIMNALGLALMCADKFFARTHRRRIPEATLMLTAALGGSVGSWLGMYLVRHKTRHPKFYLGVPLLLLVQLVLSYFLIRHIA